MDTPYSSIAAISSHIQNSDLPKIVPIEGKRHPYQSILDHIPDPAWMKDTGFRYIAINQPFLEICGKTAGALIGRTDMELWPGETAADFMANDRQVHTGGKTMRFEEAMWHDAKGRIWMEAVKMPLRDLAGNITGTIGVARNISDKKHAETALKNAEDTYRSIFENTAAATIIIDEDKTILMANSEFEKISGFSNREIEGRMKWVEFIDPVDRPRLVAYNAARLAGAASAPREYECRTIDRSGKTKEVLVRAGVIPGTRKTVGSFLDITARKRAERSLQERKAQLRAIIEAFDGFIYTCTRDYRIRFMNRSLKEHLGCDDPDRPCYELFYRRTEPCESCDLEQVLNRESAKREIRGFRGDRWYYSISSPIHGPEGGIEGKQTILIDITERKLAEDELRKKETRLRQENQRLKSSVRERYRLGDIIGKSRAMHRVYELILQAAATDANVIVYGESGTGKELVARAIHGGSDRRDSAFLPVNCAAIPENLLESEFFGYKKGAFTGAHADKAGYLDMADKGTLFLDELGEISLAMQVKLLRAIESRAYAPVGSNRLRTSDFRIIAATHQNLADKVRKKEMREDFFYRIHIIPIHLPPLRERKEDIPLLVDHFLKTGHPRVEIPPITGKILETLQAYDWPGNVRELQNVLHRYVTLKRLDFTGPLTSFHETADRLIDPEEVSDGNLRSCMEAMEKKIIVQSLEHYQWQKARTARALGIHRKTLFTKMRHHGLIG